MKSVQRSFSIEEDQRQNKRWLLHVSCIVSNIKYLLRYRRHQITNTSTCLTFISYQKIWCFSRLSSVPLIHVKCGVCPISTRDLQHDNTLSRGPEKANRWCLSLVKTLPRLNQITKRRDFQVDHFLTSHFDPWRMWVCSAGEVGLREKPPSLPDAWWWRQWAVPGSYKMHIFAFLWVVFWNRPYSACAGHVFSLLRPAWTPR